MTRWGALVVALGLASCGHEKPRPVAPPPPRLPAPMRNRHVTVSPPDWYWEQVQADVPAETKAIDLPAALDAIARVEGGARLWDDLGEPGRERLRRDGVVVLGAAAGDPPRWHMGAFYNEWRDRRVPYVLTLDALFAVAHLAITRALAEIEQREIGPLIDTMLARIDTRLAAEQRGAGVELGGGYRIARGVVAVARLIADERYVPSADIAAAVRDEKQRIDAHAGVATSPLLGVAIDYSRFASAREAARYRVMTWLSAAPLALVAHSEASGAPLDVGTVRHHARAAMLLARLADRDVDVAIHDAFSRIGRLFTFVWGPSDDLTPLSFGDLADVASIDLAKPALIANVARVDQVRALARTTRKPALWDGSGGVGAGGTSVRFLGAHASIDTVAAGTATDLATWLGTPTGDRSQLHVSVHGSLLAALLRWSATPRTKPGDRARVESALSAWTAVHHVATSFGRTKPPSAPPPGPREIRVSGAPVLAFVEPEPDTIALLLGTLGQTRRGLAALGPMQKGSPADVLLAEVEDIVKLALHVAEKTARDEPLGADDTTALAAIPSRITALEIDASDDGGPYAVVVRSNPASGQSVVSASGAIEPAVVLAREPGSHRLVVAVGAHVAHFEASERIDQSEGAAALFERRVKEGKVARAPSADGFRLAR